MLMRIDIVADIICPWSFIGVRRLRQALDTRPDLESRIFWRPYLLNPDIGPDGMDQADFLARAFGPESRVRRFQETVARAGAAVGIEFRFDQANFTPYALPAHRLISRLDGDRRLLDLADDLYTRYFRDGENIADAHVLATAAAPFGLDDIEAITSVDGTGDDIGDVAIDDAETHRLGINGVPSFVFAGRNVISGAHDSSVLTRMLEVAAVHSQNDPAVVSTSAEARS